MGPTTARKQPPCSATHGCNLYHRSLEKQRPRNATSHLESPLANSFPCATRRAYLDRCLPQHRTTRPHQLKKTESSSPVTAGDESSPPFLQSVIVLDHRSQTAALVKGVYGSVCLLHAVEVVGDVVVDRQLNEVNKKKTEPNMNTVRDR